MKIFESHAHYDDSRFDEDRDELLENLPFHNVERVINIGTSVKSSKKTIQLCEKYSHVFGSVGVHPHNVSTLADKDLQILKELAAHPKIVAIGEIGLDFYYDHSPREAQRNWFVKQIQLANETGLPLIIHSRDAAQEVFDILKQHKSPEGEGVIHCYSGSWQMAKAYTEMGFMIGIGGVITFPDSKKLKQVVEEIPLEFILLETDCPYLTPVPNRGKRNDSRNLLYIANKIAEIKGVTVETILKTTFDNGQRLLMKHV